MTDATPPRMAESERRRPAPYLGASTKISRAGGAPAEFSQPDMVGIGGGPGVNAVIAAVSFGLLVALAVMCRSFVLDV